MYIYIYVIAISHIEHIDSLKIYIYIYIYRERERILLIIKYPLQSLLIFFGTEDSRILLFLVQHKVFTNIIRCFFEGVYLFLDSYIFLFLV